MNQRSHLRGAELTPGVELSSDCEVCGFGLWLPILRMNASEIGLYSDSRFPGRCIVTMRDHFDHLSDVPAFQLMTFMEEIQFCVDAIVEVTSSSRVNVAILGNAESHVHAHLIPRYSEKEALPNKAPWEDPRPKGQLSVPEEDVLREKIRSDLETRFASSSNTPVRLNGRRKPRVFTRSTVSVPLFDLLSDGEVFR